MALKKIFDKIYLYDFHTKEAQISLLYLGIKHFVLVPTVFALSIMFALNMFYCLMKSLNKNHQHSPIAIQTESCDYNKCAHA